MLNYIEYWTSHGLSDTFTQVFHFYTLSRYFISKYYINCFYIYFVGGYETFSTKISCHFAVRNITTDAAERSTGTSSVGKTHFFNLGFHVQARALRQTWLSQEQRTNALINNVVLEPFPRYDVFHTPTIVSNLIIIN